MSKEERGGPHGPYEGGRMARLLGRPATANPHPEADDGVSDWARWLDGWEHIEEAIGRKDRIA